uniref:Uncharacterized protein n=1 Tax=Oryza punctata TaxID=4537 RepID=A0A0E0LKM6_ORYPU
MEEGEVAAMQAGEVDACRSTAARGAGARHVRALVDGLVCTTCDGEAAILRPPIWRHLMRCLPVVPLERPRAVMVSKGRLLLH